MHYWMLNVKDRCLYTKKNKNAKVKLDHFYVVMPGS